MFKKKTSKSTKKAVQEVEDQITKISNTHVVHDGQDIQVKNSLIFSMVGVKVTFM
jgi:hypothetical protein